MARKLLLIDGLKRTCFCTFDLPLTDAQKDNRSMPSLRQTLMVSESVSVTYMRTFVSNGCYKVGIKCLGIVECVCYSCLSVCLSVLGLVAKLLANSCFSFDRVGREA